jgi:indolepyruvate ferredoxin oxidoreductase
VTLAGSAARPGAAGLADAAAGPDATAPADTLDALVERRARFLTDYQNEAYARRYRALVERTRAAESALGGELALTQAVARHYATLLAIKDEYEVARLYTDGTFMRALGEQFERWDGLTFHMAPPLLARPGPDGRPRKIRLGRWLLPAMRLLAHARRVRGTWLDPFGHTAERKLERQLVLDYEALIDEVLAGLSPEKRAIAVAIASVPERIRGYGHVKLANIVTAKARWAELMDRWRGIERPEAAAKVIPIAARAR